AHPRGVRTRGPCEPADGVSAGTAQVQSFDGRPVARPTGDRTEDQGLVQRHLAMVDVALGQPEPLLQVDRREDLPVEYQALQAGYVLLGDGRRAVGGFIRL